MISPVRTCFGCRVRRSAADLQRFTVHKMNNALVIDRKKKETGRGVYCCNNHSCLERFVRNKKGLKKALRVELLDISEVEHLL